VFGNRAERDGAYDFVENPAVESEHLIAGIARATAHEASAHDFVFVPVDGSSLKLWDGTGNKDFGRIGTHANSATGVKVMSALLLDPSGVPLGLAAQSWWSRSRKKQKHPRMEKREVDEKETLHWFKCFEQASKARSERAPNTRLWFQLDRGADAWTIIRALSASEDWFTVRSRCDRRLSDGRSFLRKKLRGLPVAMKYNVALTARKKHKHQPARKKRLAQLSVRASEFSLRLFDKRRKKVRHQKINALLVRESRTTPRSEEPIQWILLTNHPIETTEDLAKIIEGYCLRWKIEDFHKSWKSGFCNVEETQLHSTDAVIRWATILATVAVRAEQLKHISRSFPDAPASEHLTVDEVSTLRLLRRKYGPNNERQPETLTISVATRWIADLGGYTGKSSGGPPGTITIQRGLQHLLIATDARSLEPPP
jgi:hypothetical protein